MFCKNCGVKLDDNSKFCPSCGTPTIANPEQGEATSSPASTPAVSKKKGDGLTKACLVFAILASLFSLGILMNMFGSAVAPLLIIFGFLFLLPAIIISIIAFVKALITFKKDHEKSKDFTKRVVAFCLSVILPCLMVFITCIFSNHIRYNKAMDYLEQGYYADAYDEFSALGDYKDCVEKAKESHYQSGIALAQGKDWAKSEAIFKELANENYRASKELYLYCDAQNRMNSAMNSAVNTLKANLKDPSSFQNLGNSCRYSFSTKGISLNIHIYGTLKYSATNSFGGRVTDTYSYEKDIILSAHNFTPEQANEILGKAIHKIASDYDRSPTDTEN